MSVAVATLRDAAGLTRPAAPVTTIALELRAATTDDAAAIQRLIGSHLNDGHLLPRTLSEIAAHAERFVVAVDGEAIVGCADLAPLSRTVAEVRSLVVSTSARSTGIGRLLVDELILRAEAAGFETLGAFTHAAGYFVRRGFSIVPHAWVPDKIRVDCASCPLFRTCGQHAVVLSLGRPRSSFVPLASFHG